MRNATELRTAARAFLAANAAANQAETDEDPANEAMFDAFQRFTDAVGFGFDADCADVARLVVDLTEPPLVMPTRLIQNGVGNVA